MPIPMRREVLCLATTLAFVACGRDSTPRADSSSATTRPEPAPATPRTTAIDPSGDSPASDGTVQVSERGVGPLKIGMALASARAATSGAFSAPPAADTAACGFARWSGGPAGLRMMTAKGRIVRVDVDSGGTTTTAGARIGDTEARIASLYAARVETTPSKYTSGHYLTIKPATTADGAYRIIFETDGKRVTRYRAGRLPEVGYVEGCG
jgi:hypothetical protein